MGRYLEKSNTSGISPNYTETTSEVNTPRFTCRCIYTTPGTYTFTVPSGVCSITTVAVGPGGCANSVVKLSEDYIYALCESISTCRFLCTTCNPSCSCCPCCPSRALDPYGVLYSSTNFSSSFSLGGYSLCAGAPAAPCSCFRANHNQVYSKIDYAIIDSSPGGGYSEKQITTTPGSTFTVVVGCYGGNNYSCINGQLCATGPLICSGAGISTEVQFICSCPSEVFSCGYTDTNKSEGYSKYGIFCYVKEKVANYCIVPGCGFGGTINRTGGLGCRICSFCFPLGFDDLKCDQCSCVCVCNCCCNPAPIFCITRCISLCTTYPILNPTQISCCPSDLSTNWQSYYCCQIRNSSCCFTLGSCLRRNTLSYSDIIRRCNISFSSTCFFDPTCAFFIPGSYCGVCFSGCCTNFIGIVTDVSISNISVACNTSGGSSGGSHCFNGVYQPSSSICILCGSSSDCPAITTSTGCGRPVFTSWCAGNLLFCTCYAPSDLKIYTTYNPVDTFPNVVAYVANSGCNPCNCRDIGCFYCTCRFDIVRNMWGIVSGPCCFAFGATGIGNSLTLCDPLRWARSIGACHCYFVCVGATTCCFCTGGLGFTGTINHYGSSTNLVSMWDSYHSLCVCNCSATNASLSPNCASCINVCYCRSISQFTPDSANFYWPTTCYWPLTTCWNCYGGCCTTNIPTSNIYEIFCDSAGKCISFCCTCTDAGKQFQTQLGEQGLEVFKAHFSPCVCSVKCFGTYCSWPCYFAGVGIGTTIPCGGDSPLVPRQELTVCDPRFIPNNYHNICVNICYGFDCSCNIWSSYSIGCVYCNSFASARSNLSRGFRIGQGIDAGAGIAYTGTASNSGYTCCFSYFTATSTCGTTFGSLSGQTAGPICGCTCGCVMPLCYTEVIAVTDYGGGGGTYSNASPTKIYRIGRCSSVIIPPSGGKGWGDYDAAMSASSQFNAPCTSPKFDTWFDVRQAKGSGARGPICVDGVCFSAVKAGPGGGGIGGFGNQYASTCVFGGAACSGTAGPGGGAGGQGVPGTGMVVIYWNP